MKRNYIPVLLSVLAMLSACGEEGGDKSVNEQIIAFKAQAPVLKSVVAHDDTTMYWSAYDNIAVYMFTDDECVESDLAEINFTSVTLKSASFYPKTFKTLDHWKDAASETSVFRAYGPAQQVAGAEGWQVPVEVPSVQTGEFGRHQILCSSEGLFSSVVNMTFFPVTAQFALRLNLTRESLSDACKIVKVEMTFNGGNVTGSNRLDLEEGRLVDPAEGNKVTVVLEEPIRISNAISENEPSHFNQYITCALIPSETVESVSVVVYDRNGNVFTTEASIPSRVLQAGRKYSCDAFFYLDKIIANDILDSDADDGFGPDWEIEL